MFNSNTSTHQIHKIQIHIFSLQNHNTDNDLDCMPCQEFYIVVVVEEIEEVVLLHDFVVLESRDVERAIKFWT